MDKKYSYLLKNIGLMTMSNFGTKILSFLMVPLYTSFLTTEEYGIYDLYLTTLFLLTPILSLNISDAVMRFSMDKNNNRSIIFTNGLKQYVFACILCCSLVVVNFYGGFIAAFNQYPYFFVTYFIFSLLNDFLSQFARGCERILDVALAGIINSSILLGLNVILLVVFNSGLEGYFIANCVAYAISSMYLLIRLKVWKYIDFSVPNKLLKREMLAYSIPMGVGNIGWWVNNVSDRYIVTWICGVAANGVYSVAYKIPSLLTIFQLIFNQAWQLSAIKEYEGNDSGFYSNIYNFFNCGMVFVCSVLIIFDKLIAKILFANEFYLAWKFAPILMISVVFSSLAQLLGGILAAGKKSAVFGRTIVVGAVVNIILNFILVPFIGSYGAAVATVISYVVIWVVRLWETYKFVRIEIRIVRDVTSYCILCAQTVALLLIQNVFGFVVIEGILLLGVVFLYINEIREFTKKIKKYLG